MDEDTWIRTHICQRKCTVFSRLGDKRSCKCWRRESEHPDPKSIHDEDWSTSRNTTPEPCRNYGKISFGEEQTSKYVRIDVQTEMSVVEQLLLEVWRLPRPKWIFSVIGDQHGQADKRANELRCQLKGLMKSLSNGQNIWITTEGIQFGIAKMVGEYIKDMSSKYITPVGVYAWGGVDEKVMVELETEKPRLEEETIGNRPSALYKHHLLVDDGSLNQSHVHKSFQEFRMTLETTMTKHSEGTSSTPLVALLYCGWSYVLDGVQAAIDNNIPVVVLQGTGGFADVLASVFTHSKEDRTSASRGRDKEWTGTVIDEVLRDQVKVEFTKVQKQEDEAEVLRDQVKVEFTKVQKQEDEAGQYKILQCLQKRELITVVNIDEEETTLVNAVIQALLKSKPVPEILQILDYYMPARLFDGEGAAAAALNIREQREHLSETTGMFLVQAMLMDQAESVQFIIDYNGVDLAAFFTDTVISELWKMTHCSQNLEDAYNLFPLSTATSCGPREDVFRRLMIWAVRTDRLKCAALFWKKGTHLLTSSLLAASVLRSRVEDEENIGRKKTLEAQSILFQNRAIGLLNKCYDDNKERTLDLIQSQSAGNIWQEDLLRCSLATDNRRIFAEDGYRAYTRRVWLGKINPPLPDTYKTPKKLNIKEDEAPCASLGRLAIAPVTTYSLNLLFYICFLGIFGHTLLFELKEEFSVLEGILVGWWFTFVWEEIRQIVKTKRAEQFKCCRDKCCCSCRWKLCSVLKAYFFDNYWNMLDCVSLGCFLVGGILMTIVHLDTSRTDVYEAARVILSLDIMFFTWRILQHVAIFSIMGPVLEMIFQMIKDLFPFLVIMAVFIISHGLAVHSLLYPNRDWSPEALIDIPKSAFWNLFGELGLDEIEASETQGACSSNPLLFENDTMDECPSTLGKYFVPFLLALHMLLLNVLLLNILIARFSFTFQMVHDQIKWLAAWQKARVILEYYSKPPLPPPFNVFFDVGNFLYACCRTARVAPKEDNCRNEEMDSWERSMGEYYLATDELTPGSERISPFRDKSDNKEDKVKMVRAIREPSRSGEVASSDNGMDISKVEDLAGALSSKILQKMKSDLKKTIAAQIGKEMRLFWEQCGPHSAGTSATAVSDSRVVTLGDYGGEEENV